MHLKIQRKTFLARFEGPARNSLKGPIVRQSYFVGSAIGSQT
jgi:hypothetical protein